MFRRTLSATRSRGNSNVQHCAVAMHRVGPHSCRAAIREDRQLAQPFEQLKTRLVSPLVYMTAVASAESRVLARIHECMSRELELKHELVDVQAELRALRKRLDRLRFLSVEIDTAKVLGGCGWVVFPGWLAHVWVAARS